ncbi:MAG: TIGR04463 family radical SAM/SPASM RiPP maturase [Cyanobacteria bacterium SID2]|nr:TIGR04463 family radical SAM/SPASM RiPP maturase [Cyanobacteria bacterium SID2]MBP0005820.1 TIGR04463 family radical SAM/SPASM RiPP maturase [Cyanobacteria bacterium SBC]
MKSSRYNIFVPLREGRLLAYNGFSGALSVWNQHEQEKYRDLAEGANVDLADPVLCNLAYGGYLVQDEIDEVSLLEEYYTAHRFNPRTMILTLAPTLSCNFGCDYCFQGQDKPSATMSPDVQDAIVDFVNRSRFGIDRLHVAWYGGEPLLQPKVIESLSDRLIEICDRRRIQYDATIVTNGYRLDREMAQSLSQRRVRTVQVTLDGDAKDHDLRRLLRTGKPTFERITANLKENVDRVPLVFSIRVNIDRRNHLEIRQLIDRLADMGLNHRKNLQMYFAPVEAMTEGCHNVAGDCMTKRQYGSLEADLYRYGFEKGLAPLPYPPRFHGVCGAVRPNAFVITPTGDIHKCWDTVTFPEHKVGTIFDMKETSANEKTQAWLDWSPFVNETCRNCKLLPNCSGACAYKFVHSQNTVGEAAILPCPSWKYNIKERLLLRALKMGAITEADYDPQVVQTDPSELCADVYLPGKALPDKIAATYTLSAR